MKGSTTKKQVKIHDLPVQSCITSVPHFIEALLPLLFTVCMSINLPEETLMVMISSPSLLLTLQVTVRFTLGITVILWVALPLM